MWERVVLHKLGAGRLLIPEAVTCSRGSGDGLDRPSPPTHHRRGSGKNASVSEICNLWRNCALPCT